MNKLSEDLSIKIVMLNEKRIQDLNRQLGEYLKALRNYYLEGAKTVDPNQSTENNI